MHMKLRISPGHHKFSHWPEISYEMLEYNIAAQGGFH